MTSDVVTTERIGAAMVVRIDRESSGNAISREVVAGLAESVREAEAADVLAAVVITGRGDKFFAAGGDLKQYREIGTRDELAAAFARPRALMDAIEALPMPVIAAINGYALGGGAELALAADLRIASPNARIGFPYVKLGLIAGWDGMERLVRCCGYGHAMHLLLTGGAHRARERGRLRERARRGACACAALCGIRTAGPARHQDDASPRIRRPGGRGPGGSTSVVRRSVGQR